MSFEQKEKLLQGQPLRVRDLATHQGIHVPVVELLGGIEGRAKSPLIDANIVGYQSPKAGTKVSQIASGVKGFE